MANDSTKSSNSQPATDTAVYLFDDWFDLIEAACGIGCAALSKP